MNSCGKTFSLQLNRKTEKTNKTLSENKRFKPNRTMKIQTKALVLLLLFTLGEKGFLLFRKMLPFFFLLIMTLCFFFCIVFCRILVKFSGGRCSETWNCDWNWSWDDVLLCGRVQKWPRGDYSERSREQNYSILGGVYWYRASDWRSRQKSSGSQCRAYYFWC